MRKLWRSLRLLLGALLAALRALRTSVILLVVLAMLALNVASLTFAGLNAALSGVLEKVAGLDTLSRRQAERLQRVEADLDGTRRRLAASQDHLSRTRTELQSTNARLDRTRGELASSRADLRALAASNARERNGFADERERLKADLRDARHVTVRGERTRVEDAVRQTTGAISRRARTLGLANITAMAGEAVPVAGAGFMIAMTGWEIAETCQMMQDAHDLASAFEVADPSDPARREACGFEVPSISDVWALVCSGPPAPVRDLPEGAPRPEPDEDAWWEWLFCQVDVTPELAAE